MYNLCLLFVELEGDCRSEKGNPIPLTTWQFGIIGLEVVCWDNQLNQMAQNMYIKAHVSYHKCVVTVFVPSKERLLVFHVKNIRIFCKLSFMEKNFLES